MYQTAYAERYQNLQEENYQTYEEWLKAEFYNRVMNYLSDYNPRELMREEYLYNIEKIYKDMKTEYKRFDFTYEELAEGSEMNWILELWNYMAEEKESNELRIEEYKKSIK